MMPPNVTSLREAIDYHRCPRCESRLTYAEPPVGSIQHLEIYTQRRYCNNCNQPYRVTFRAVRVEAE
jgi:uncharacterized protein with PIN domain